MKALDIFSVERLEDIISSHDGKPLVTTMGEIKSLARIALAAKRAEESHSRREVWDGGNTWVQCSRQAYDRHEAAGKRVRVLYERPQLNSPAVPDGWKLVPIEPTDSMIINGSDSEPNESFSDEKAWEQYDDMTGCQQAAYRAELCWHAMLAAAPERPL